MPSYMTSIRRIVLRDYFFMGAALALLSALTLLPVVTSHNWPLNHEYYSFYLRTMVWAEHMLQGDWFPIWSTMDNNGFGSPQPLMYHKLFYLLAGGFYAITGLLKVSILLSIWGGLMVGAIGIYALCRAIGCVKPLAWCGAIMLVTANYTITNWLIRGAMAEFFAAMLVPWVLAAFTHWLNKDGNRYRANGWLGLTIGLLYLGHSVLGFYMVLLLGSVTLILLLSRAILVTRLAPLPLLFGIGVLAILIGPYLGVQFLIAGDYDMSRIIPAEYRPEKQIKPLNLYFWDANWKWGHVWNSYTVQLDWPVLLLLVTGIIYNTIVFVMRWKKNGGFNPEQAWFSRLAVSLPVKALILLLALAFILQTHWATLFYSHFPGAEFIQFPWRLLGVMTPCLIALALMCWPQHSRVALRIVIMFTTIMTLFSGAWAHMRYEELPSPPSDLTSLKFSAFGEYVPSKAPKIGYQVKDINSDLIKIGCKLTEKGLTTSVIKAQAWESISTSYTLTCPKAGTYPLPLFSSPLHRLKITGDDEVTASLRRCDTSPKYPNLCAIRIIEAGSYTVQIEMPTFLGIITPWE